MSRIIIDAGNTNFKVFIFKDSDIISRLISNSQIQVIDWLKNQKLKNDIYCIYSSVRNDDAKLIEFLKASTLFIEFSYDLNLPIKINYKTPETLGKDRIAAACGASTLFNGENVLIIDVGTAITYDMIIEGKNFVGGNISPGIALRFKALNQFTGKLPLINYKDYLTFDFKDSFLGQNTKDALVLGVFIGIKNEIEGIINNALAQYKDLKVVFTGGDTIYLHKLLNFSIFACDDLIAIGLNEILKINV
ncbi:MAG: type III pantothenate kinase [Bacteroidales bacterium]|jgi:type III pantothenate kinase|nr:type III pantothenate kinase [Bacteroidales bacterium]HOL97599.1 type III pantothenate kinase [Bacteroidales bacterium]HOM36740.1 type III pantothenate kinase [Bacteroidales bacterium]HUM32700.1 type III pantothenate kinase [Bacteroidales bacterium]